MLSFKNYESKINFSETSLSNICYCCKDELSNLDDDYTKLSCNHEYHYDCIYFAFCANKKRGSSVLECPYCRKKVKSLPEKDGFKYDSSIHSGITNYGFGNKLEYKWAALHQGNDYCIYSKNGKFCNVYGSNYGLGKKYCWGHRNNEHLGENFCKYKNSQYCNHPTTTKGYCASHSEYATSSECIYIYQNGKCKGTICKKLTLNMSGLCCAHIKYKDKIYSKSNTSAIENTPITIICNELIKTGPNKGKICGVVQCKRHNKSNQPEQVSVNSTKIVQLTGIDDSPLAITVHKSVNDIALLNKKEYVELTNLDLLEINGTLLKLQNVLDINGKEIVNQLINKYFSI
jgi:hypothetical protein